MDHDLTPVLIGAGQITEKQDDINLASSPMDLMEQAVWQAVDSAGFDRARMADLDTIAVVKSLFEFTRNSPHTLAQRVGANPARQWITPVGGNMPQYAVNRFAEDIANGKAKFVLLAATEAMATGRKIVKAGGKPDWREPADTDPESLVFERELCTAHEALYDIWPARFVYPMFENALRGRYGHSIEEHQMAMGKLFARFSEVAADNPHAWYPISRTASEIATPSAQNRFVSWPYTKFMNAMNQVNQSAAVVMTSRGFAKELGVAEDKMVYLHGCGDANELWHVSERADYATSPAIRAMGRQALQMAGRGIEEMDYIDIYACFPVAVQMARDELGIAVDDPRPLTITGGLPYHGGANAYVMNAIAAMVDKVRDNPGKFGIVTANGGYLTEHAAGIYSTEPSPIPATGEAPWQRMDPAIDQAKLDATPHPDLTEEAMGAGVIETYTVGFGRDNQPNKGIVIGRLGDGSDPAATRFLANTPVDTDLFTAMTREDFLGAPGKVRHADGRNIFTPN